MINRKREEQILKEASEYLKNLRFVIYILYNVDIFKEADKLDYYKELEKYDIDYYTDY